MVKIGKVFFKDLEFEVFNEVYEPREDSYMAAEYLYSKEWSGKDVLDMGTGTGFLGIICSKKGGNVDAVDVNPGSIKNARKNAELNNAKLNVFESYLFDEISKKYDAILFNAPYLPVEKENLSEEEKAWAGGKKGHEKIVEFLDLAPEYLKKKGVIILVFSSLSGEDTIKDKIDEKGLESTVLNEKKVEWEKLLLMKCSKF